MISVLFMIPTLDRGGAENVLVNLVNNMDQDRFQITVQTLFDEDSQKDQLKEGIKYKSFLHHQFHGNSRLFAMIPAKLLYRAIVRKQYDIVVSYLEGPTAHILSGCPYPYTKKVSWIHSALDTKRGLTAGFISKEAAIQAYKNFDKVVFVAETVKKKIEETAETAFPNACVLYNAINTEEIVSRSKERITKFAFPEHEFCIISTGKIDLVKGYDRLAHVQKKLIDSGYKTHVYVLGEGKERKRIEAYTRENAIADSFTFLGFYDNPYPYIAGADLFVCSSRREGFSTAVSEALVLGVPVVSTDCSGAKELLGENNEHGIVTENSEEALYEGVKQLLDDPNRLKYYRVQAQKRGKLFDMEKTVQAVEEMLEEVWKT